MLLRSIGGNLKNIEHKLRDSKDRLHPLLKTAEVSEMTGLSVPTLERRRMFRLPPKWIRLGGVVRYRLEDVQAWIASSEEDSK